jgi:membrane dipeptidase
MNHKRRYVDMLGFLGDVGPPMFDDCTLKNVRKSGVRLFVLTTTWPMLDWKDSLKMHRQAGEQFAQHSDMFHIVRCKNDLQKALDGDMLGVIFGMQDPGCIDTRFERIQQLFEEGIRVIQVAYQKTNSYGCGFLAESDDRGLTDAGRRFVESVNKAGMVLDLSHLAPRTALDCIKVSRGPTMISHTVSRAVYDHPRGSTDDVLRAMARLKDTIVGVLAMTFFLDPANNGLAPLIDHIRHVAEVLGPDKVVLGTDGPVGGFTDLDDARSAFEEKTQQMMDPRGELKSRWPTHIPEIFEDAIGFDRIHETLSAYFSPDGIAGITGGNAWRFLSEHLPV